MAQALDRPAAPTASVARAVVPLSAAVASGVLLWASAPAVGVGWVAWIALMPAAAVGRRAHGTRLGRLAVPLAYGVYLELMLVPALPFGLARDQWGDEPVVPILVGDSPVLAVGLVAVPVFTALLYAIRFPELGRARSGLAVVLVPAAAWTALDVVRVKLDPGGLFGPLFLSQSDTAASGLAALGGPWLLTFALVAVNYALAAALLRGRALVLVAAPLGVAAAFAAAPSSGSVVVAAVQPGYDTSEFELPFLRSFQKRQYEPAALDLIENLAPLTREAARRGARIVVWPEAALWVDPHSTATARAALLGLARETGTVLVVPYFLRGPAHSAAVLVYPDGKLGRPQPKQRPMWFLGERRGSGRPARPEPTAFGPLGAMLGVDNQDPGVARALADRGAALVTSSTHDWEQLAPYQRELARLHSAALRLPVVRADWRYGSAIYDRGRLVADAGDAKRRTVLVARVRAAAGRTAYARFGDVFGWAAVAAGAALALSGVLRRRRTSG